eukprot:307042_1
MAEQPLSKDHKSLNKNRNDQEASNSTKSSRRMTDKILRDRKHRMINSKSNDNNTRSDWKCNKIKSVLRCILTVDNLYVVLIILVLFAVIWGEFSWFNWLCNRNDFEFICKMRYFYYFYKYESYIYFILIMLIVFNNQWYYRFRIVLFAVTFILPLSLDDNSRRIAHNPLTGYMISFGESISNTMEYWDSIWR